MRVGNWLLHFQCLLHSPDHGWQRNQTPESVLVGRRKGGREGERERERERERRKEEKRRDEHTHPSTPYPRLQIPHIPPTGLHTCRCHQQLTHPLEGVNTTPSFCCPVHLWYHQQLAIASSTESSHTHRAPRISLLGTKYWPGNLQPFHTKGTSPSWSNFLSTRL